MATTTTRGVPTITLADIQSPQRLQQYLLATERSLLQLILDVRDLRNAERPTGDVHIDFEAIRAQLSADGQFPLNVDDLPGVLGDAQAAGLLVSSVEPSPSSYPINTLLLQTGSPDVLKYLKAGTPAIWTTITASSAVPANMMTTDTNQTPGATVVKTWTAQQIFNGGIDLNGSNIADCGDIACDDITADVVDAVTLDVSGTSLLAGIVTAQSGFNFQSCTGVSSSPFAVTTAHCVLFVDTSAARTLNLPAVPATGMILFIKDDTGGAGANNITISGNGNNIDGAASTTITTNRGAVILIYQGSQWIIVSRLV